MYGAANASPRSGEVGARLRAPGGRARTYVRGGKCLPTQWGGRRSLASAGWGKHALIRFAGHPTYGAANASPRSGEVGARLRAPGGRARTNQVCGPPYVWGGKCLPTQWGGRRSLASAGWGEYVLIRFAGHHQDVGRCELHLSIIRLVQLLDQQPL